MPTADRVSRNAQELVWHCAAAQVQLVMGITIAGLPADSVFFVKTRKGMEASLAWLDGNLDQVVASLADYPTLVGLTARFGSSEAARATSFRFEPEAAAG